MTEMQSLNPMMLALFLGALSLVPMLMIICTCFLKISMVLMLTRNAMGVQQVPPNMALYGIALAATLFVMAPVFNDISQRVQAMPLDFSNMERLEYTFGNGAEPLRNFMSHNTDPDILVHLQENGARMWPKEMAQSITSQSPLLIIPAFVLSELQNGFKIGFLIFIPFLGGRSHRFQRAAGAGDADGVADDRFATAENPAVCAGQRLDAAAGRPVL